MQLTGSIRLNNKQKSPSKNRSPTKENQSPTKAVFQKCDSQNQTIEKLCCYLKGYGIDVPEAVLEKVRELSSKNSNVNTPCKPSQSEKEPTKMAEIFLIPSSRSDIKSGRSSEEEKKQRQIRILQVRLNDHEFELKKINEDFAQFKVLARLEKEKEVRRFRQPYEDLKKQFKEENQSWTNRFKIREKQLEEKMRAFRERNQLEKREEVQAKIQLKQTQFNTKIRQLRQKNEYLTEKLNNLNEEMQISKEKEISTVRVDCQTKIHQIIQQKDQETAKQLEIKTKEIKKIEVAKETTQGNMKEAERELKQTKEHLYHELYISRRETGVTKQKAEQSKKQNQFLVQQVTKKTQEIKQLQAANSAAERFIEEKKQRAIEVMKDESRKQIQQILEKHDQITSGFEDRLKDLQDSKQEIQRIQRNSELQLERQFEQRPSRAEDINRIKRLQYEAMCRQEQIRKMRSDLKKTRMEHENNEKNYNRIFTSNGSRHIDKKSLSKDARDVLSKCSNTLDMKYMLKIYANQNHM